MKVSRETDSDYPRLNPVITSQRIDRLPALVDGYFWLRKTFVIALLIGIATLIFMNVLSDRASVDVAGTVNGILLIVVLIAITIMFYRPCKRLEVGLGGSKHQAIFLTGVIVIFGPIGYAIVQSVARASLFSYKLNRRMLYRKKRAQAFIEQLRSEQDQAPVELPTPPPIQVPVAPPIQPPVQ